MTRTTDMTRAIDAVAGRPAITAGFIRQPRTFSIGNFVNDELKSLETFLDHR